MSPKEGRPCRAEVRWYGATDAGLRDVRDNVRLWGMKSEIARHAELSAMPENKNKTPLEISIMVLNEDWPLRKRKRMYTKLKGVEYHGP